MFMFRLGGLKIYGFVAKEFSCVGGVSLDMLFSLVCFC